MTDEPRIINTEKDLKYAREMETSGELDAMAATILALWKERDALTNLGCKAVDLTTEISESAGKKIADLRAMVDTEIERVAELCRGEADAVFIKTPHAVVTGTIERISKRLHEKLGEDTLVILLEGGADVETLDEKEMRERGWVRSRNPFPEYPREIACEGCGNVVAFGPATLQDDSPIIAGNLIRPDGKQPRDRDPLCLNCGESSMGIFRLTGGGPFTVRDRARRCLHCGGDGKIDAGGFHTVQNCPTCNGRGRLPAQADRDAMVPPCPACNGTGREVFNPGRGHKPYPTCNGTGADDGHVDDGAPNPAACPDCEGSGVFSNAEVCVDPCTTCNGTGKISKEGPNDGTTDEP